MKPAFIRPNKRKTPVAKAPQQRYSTSLKSRSLRTGTADTRDPLEPLRHDKPVILEMSKPKVESKRIAANRAIPIVLVPGKVIGAPRGKLLVSVIGHGAAIIDSVSPEALGQLVLAGIPVKLAKVLIDGIRHTLFRSN